MLAQIEAFLRRWLPAFEDDQRSYLTVAIGCTGGQHRSVYFAELLAQRFAAARGARWCAIANWTPHHERQRRCRTRPSCRCSRCRRVLFPGGLLELKVFEARYLDLCRRCLREQRAVRRGLPAPGQRGPRAPASTVALRVDRRAGRADRRRQRAGRHPARALPRHAALRGRRDAAQQADGLWLAEAHADRRRRPRSRRRASACRRVQAWPTRSRRSKRKGAEPFLAAATASTTPAGSPTAGARSCRSAGRQAEADGAGRPAAAAATRRRIPARQGA